jgi:hypothetical protein
VISLYRFKSNNRLVFFPRVEELLKAASSPPTPSVQRRAKTVDVPISGENRVPEKYKEALTAFEGWLSQAEEALESSRNYRIQNEHALKELMAKFMVSTYHFLLIFDEFSIFCLQVFDREIQSQEDSWYFVRDRGQQFVSASGNPWLEAKVDILEKRWDELKSDTQSVIHRIEKDLGELCQFEEEFEGLESWIAEVNVFLSTDDAAYGDVEMLEAQLEQNVGVGDDIKSLESTMTGVKACAVDMKARGSEEFQEWIQSKIDSLDTSWNKIVSEARFQEQVLTEALEKTRKVVTSLRAFSDWLDSAESRVTHAVDEESVETPEGEKPEDFNKILNEIQLVKEGAQDRSVELEKLSETGKQEYFTYQS